MCQFHLKQGKKLRNNPIAYGQMLAEDRKEIGIPYFISILPVKENDLQPGKSGKYTGYGEIETER